MCRFGLPEQLITDNARQFEAGPWVEFCRMYAIRHTTSSVAYPQANGQAENMIRTIMDGLRWRMLASGASWAEDLPYILWAYRTTPRRATLETPFALAYGF